jgi:hypothetical protein
MGVKLSVPETPWRSTTIYPYGPIVLQLGQFWNREERDKAKQAWAKGVYLTLCTAFRAADSAPILNRTVFKIVPGKNDGPGILEVPADDAENIVLP